MFSKNHYVTLAKALKDINKCALVDDVTMSLVVRKLANVLEKDNSKFDDIKFIRAVYKSD